MFTYIYYTNLSEGVILLVLLYSYVVDKQACKQCHPECRICEGYGLSLSSCKSCLHFQQDDRCVRNCSSDYYIKNQTNICLRCDSRCLHCVGPTASDCTVCKQYVVYHDMDDQTKGVSYFLMLELLIIHFQ